MLDEIYVIEEGGVVLFEQCFDQMASPQRRAELLARFIRETFLSQKPRDSRHAIIEGQVFYFCHRPEAGLLFVAVSGLSYQQRGYGRLIEVFAEAFTRKFAEPACEAGLHVTTICGARDQVACELQRRLESFTFDAPTLQGEPLRPAEAARAGKAPDEKRKPELKARKKLDFSSKASFEGSQGQEYFKASSDKEDSFLALDDSGEEEAAAKPAQPTLLRRLREAVSAVRDGKSVADSVKPALEGFQQTLVAKNVSDEIARKICQSLEERLVAQKASLFASVTRLVRESLKEVLTEILTPRTHIDLLSLALKRREEGRPLVVTFVGVNGVGKSTNLAKVAHYFKTNGFSVLLAACDNFRAGAVEQIKAHGRYLGLPVYDRAYKDDAANIARDAIAEARARKIEVVLVDTAGRMQDNEPLMKALGRLVSINKPDVILFIGEAVAGNDIIDQLTKFNASLQHFTELHSAESRRGIDGILLSKYDVVGDKVGAAISLTYATGKPIVFVGVGQKYPDLKKLNVESVVHNILK